MTSRLARQRDRLRRLSPDSVWELARVHGQVRNERDLLALARAGRDVCWPSEHDEPLVTVRIATYNRGDLILERALASAIRQTYSNLEILVVGDACDAATSDAVRRCEDPRVRFVNLAQRGLYPTDPSKRWAVAGTQPMNAALFLAAGDWIAPCDDDDELVDDHVEVLLGRAREQRLEMLYSQAACEQPDGSWTVVGAEPLRWGGVTHGSVLWSAGLRFMLHSMSSWKLGWPGDWELMRRMDRVGVRIGFLPRVTYRHYAEARHRTAGA